MELSATPVCQDFSVRCLLLRAPGTLPCFRPSGHLGRPGPAFRNAGNERRQRLVCSASERDETSTVNTGGGDESIQEFGSNPLPFVGFSTLFYGAMLGGSIYVADVAGAPIVKEFMPPYDLLPGLICTVPLCFVLLAIIDFGDQLEEVQEIKALLQKTIIPLVNNLPLWGPFLLALGAGIGEEAAYRALVQSGAVARIGAYTNTTVATAAGIAVAAGLFGAGHALNRFYFWWATFAGVYFGVEYVLYGLPATALTHTLYDWFAFVYVAFMWGSGPGSMGNQKKEA